jgi:hypothetical protein
MLMSIMLLPSHRLLALDVPTAFAVIEDRRWQVQCVCLSTKKRGVVACTDSSRDQQLASLTL